jgi:hypothetical protein
MIYDGWFNKKGFECDIFACKRLSPAKHEFKDMEAAALNKGFEFVEVGGQTKVLCDNHSVLYQMQPERWLQELAEGERKRIEYLRYIGSCKIRGRLDTDSNLPWTLIPEKIGQSFRI